MGEDYIALVRAKLDADHVIVRMGDDHYDIPFTLGDTKGDGVSDDLVFDLRAAQKVEGTWVAAAAAAGPYPHQPTPPAPPTKVTA